MAKTNAVIKPISPKKAVEEASKNSGEKYLEE